MNERDYSNATNIIRLRTAQNMLRELTTNEDIPADLVGLATRTVSRLVIHLESSMDYLTGCEGEWVGVCGKPITGTCTSDSEHRGECSA